MYKKAIIFLSLFSSVSVFAATKTQQKKVCNTLENGAEFCTIYNSPVDDKPKKTVDEINSELEKKSELVLRNKNDPKSSKTEELKKEVETRVVTPPIFPQQQAKKVETPKKEDPQRVTQPKKEVAEKETKEERIARRKLKKEQAKKAKEEAEQQKHSKAKKTEDLVVVKKDSPEVSKAEQKPTITEVAHPKPSLKDKKSFSEFLNTVKNLD